MTTLSESVSNAVDNLSDDDLSDLASVIIESAIKGDQLSLQFVLECEIDAIKQAKLSRFKSDLSALLSETVPINQDCSKNSFQETMKP